MKPDYNIVSFLQNTHNGNHKAHLWGQPMWCLLWVQRLIYFSNRIRHILLHYRHIGALLFLHFFSVNSVLFSVDTACNTREASAETHAKFRCFHSRKYPQIRAVKLPWIFPGAPLICWVSPRLPEMSRVTLTDYKYLSLISSEIKYFFTIHIKQSAYNECSKLLMFCWVFFCISTSWFHPIILVYFTGTGIT